jgi:hypothetical protein
MQRRSTDRRTLLKLAGSTAATASLGGCSELPSLGGDVPPYRDWIPAGSAANGRSGFAYVETTGTGFDTQQLVEASGIETEPDALAGFMLLYAGYGTAMLSVGSGAGVLRNASLATLLPDAIRSEDGQRDNRTETGNQTGSGEQPGSSTIEGVLVAGNAIVLFGDVDVDGVRSALADAYETVGTRDGYTLFERSEGDARGQFAAGDDAIVLPLGVDSKAIVGTMLDTVSGDGTRLAEQGDMDWAIDAAGSGQLVYGGRDPSAAANDTDGFDLESLFENALPWDFQNAATGVVSSMEYSDGSFEGEAALAYEQSGDVPDEGTIQNQVTPTSADDYEISVDGTRVRLTGRWEAVTDADQEDNSS